MGTQDGEDGLKNERLEFDTKRLHDSGTMTSSRRVLAQQLVLDLDSSSNRLVGLHQGLAKVIQTWF
jgi:hypothetical protein